MKGLEEQDTAAIEWLLSSREPSIRLATLTEVLGEDPRSPPARKAAAHIFDGELMRGLLSGHESDGGFGVHPYKKWVGAHWRLISMIDLGIPPGEPRAIAALDQVFSWLMGKHHREGIKKINGLTRRCASQEGNALGVASRLGLSGDQRVQGLASDLQGWQWPDGGWNCDKSPEAHHSSFHETLIPTWGLWEFYRATGDKESLSSAEKGAELLLRHRLFHSETTGVIIHPEWVKLHYPPYWHYDVLQSLRVLGRMGKLGDRRTQEALDLLISRRLKDGRWRPGGYWWVLPGKRGHLEAVNWGRGGPNEMITLNALRVLKAAGRLD